MSEATDTLSVAVMFSSRLTSWFTTWVIVGLVMTNSGFSVSLALQPETRKITTTKHRKNRNFFMFDISFLLCLMIPLLYMHLLV